MKKSQITIFMIIGILLLASAGFVLFIYKTKMASRTEPEVVKISDVLDRDSTMRYYLITCLDQVSRHALKIAGSQSGYIYDDQAQDTFQKDLFYNPSENKDYGVHLIPFWYNGVMNDVAYGIYAPQANCSTAKPISPDYPYFGSLTANPVCPNSLGNSMAAYQRLVALPPLCYTNGSNRLNLSGFQWSCESYSNKPADTVQYFLEQYIANKTEECMNITFVEGKGYNISQYGSIKASVLFGEENVVVVINYPITISLRGRQPYTNVLTFTAEEPVRFKKIYELASHMIKEEVKNIFFDFRNETLANYPADCPGFNITSQSRKTNNVTCLYPGMKVLHYRDVCYHSYPACNKSDIVVINDTRSIIDGNPLLFMFAIQNRAPALDYMDESVESNTYYYGYMKNIYGLNLTKTYEAISSPSSRQNYNIVAEVGSDVSNILRIIPLAIDPEEDQLQFSYSGWMTPINISNITGGRYQYLDVASGTPYLHYGRNVSGDITETCNWWQNSQEYNLNLHGTRKGKDADFPDIYSREVPCDTFKDKLTYKDVGYHWVRVNVSDGAGKYDWQDIKIQVRCKPEDPCCNVSADYMYKQENASCGQCMRCATVRDVRKCVADTSDRASETCPACMRCGSSGGNQPCTQPIDGEQLHRLLFNCETGRTCCAGTCAAPRELAFDRCEQCYDPDPKCNGHTKEYRFLSGTCGPGGLGKCVQEKCVQQTLDPDGNQLNICYTSPVDGVCQVEEPGCTLPT